MSEISHSSPRLPWELVQLIGEIAIGSGDKETGATLLHCSRTCYDLVCPALYRKVTIDGERAASLFCGLEFPHPQWQLATDPNPSALSGLWPEVRIATEEELQASSEDAIATYMPYPASTESHHRKLNALAMVRHLTVDSVPPVALCNALGRLYGVRKVHAAKEGYPFTRVFGGVDKLVLGPHTIWAMADWHNRHSIPSNPHHPQPHPFATWIALECNPKAVYMIYPTLSQGVRSDWVNIRNGPRELIDAGEGQRIRTVRLQHHWQTFTYSGFWSALIGMMMKWRPHELIQQNIVACPPLATTAAHSVVVFGTCQCQLQPGRWPDCPDHVDAAKRARRVLKMMVEMKEGSTTVQSQTRFNFVDIGKVTGLGTEEEKETQVMDIVTKGVQGIKGDVPEFSIKYQSRAEFMRE